MLVNRIIPAVNTNFGGKIDTRIAINNNSSNPIADNRDDELEKILQYLATVNNVRKLHGFEYSQDKIITTKSSIKVYDDKDNIIKFYWLVDGNWHKVNLSKVAKHGPNYKIPPAELYEMYGKNINYFCRTGEFYNDQFKNGKIPDIDIETIEDESLKEYFRENLEKAQNENRMIIDSIEQLDIWTGNSTTLENMVVYRDAPISWVQNTDHNGIITEPGFCSTSTEPGASLEGIIGSNSKYNKTYKIILPKGTQYGDLTYTSEKEMTLPRGSQFLQVSDDTLILIRRGYSKDDCLRLYHEIFDKHNPAFITESASDDSYATQNPYFDDDYYDEDYYHEKQPRYQYVHVGF